MVNTRFRGFAWATLAFTLAVILWGAYVRASGSGAGCGSHWPTCNGDILPRPKTIQTVVELAHRVTSGAITLVVFAELVWAFVAFPRRHPVRAGAVASMILVLTEGAVGAAIVLLQYVEHDKSAGRALWMSIHLINTFFLIAALTCTAWWASGGAAIRARGRGLTLNLIVVGAIGLLTIGVSGAITALGDTLFAATSLARGLADDLSPAAHFLQQLRVIHPIAAVLVAVFLLYARSAIAAARATPAARRLSFGLAALLVAQMLLGVVNLVLLAPVAMQLVHLLAADLVWITFVLLSAEALGESAERVPAAVVPGAEEAARGGSIQREIPLDR
ncbi:MAG: COX15/CtaA family protein [Byssovorax sp.]